MRRTFGSLKTAKMGRLVATGLAILAAVFLTATATAQNKFIERGAPLPNHRGFHGTAVLGDYLYVFGGRSSEVPGQDVEVDDTAVWKARIFGTGQTGPWEKTTPLPGPRYYIVNSTLALNDVVYIVGGSTAVLNGKSINTAIYAKPLPDGTLTPWQTSAPFPGEGLSCPTAVTTPGHLHILGGQSTGFGVQANVWTNPIYADGSLSTWEPGPPLPIPLWFHQSGVVGGRVYVWGGLPNNNNAKPDPSPYVFSSPILGSGKLGPWRRERMSLPVGIYRSATAVAGNYLMSFSPSYAGGVIGGDVVWTQVTPEGLQPWQRRVVDIPNRVYQSVAPDYRRGSIYITGGRVEKEGPLLKDTAYFLLSQSARQEAERAWLAAQKAHTNSVSALTQADPRVPATLSFEAQMRLDGAIPGFKTITDARTAATRENKRLIVYFNLKDAAPCEEQKQMLRVPEFSQVANESVFAWVDAQDFPQLAQQMGVYRVPTWIFFDSRGNRAADRIGVMSMADLQAQLQQVR